jgi:tetratricopeptide (TPR) repeat protein
VIGRLEPNRNKLKPSEQRDLDLLHAGALVQAGQRDEAVARYQRLAQSDPNDGEIAQRLAELLLDSNARGELEQALAQWRLIATRSRPDSARWWLAKYNVALAQFKLGEKPEAAKLIRYLKATKGLGDAQSASRFESLLRQCE